VGYTALGMPLDPAQGRSAIRISAESVGRVYCTLSDNGGRNGLLVVLL
jgi:hypothetical protein